MIVYVESNFPLELARRQEESVAVEEILGLAEARRIELVFPQLAVLEPFGTLDRYASERNRLLADLQRQLTELSRSHSHHPLVANIQPLVATLATLRADETSRLENTVARMLGCGRSLPLTGAVFGEAVAAEQRLDLSPQDAIVFATIVADLTALAQPGETCFVSRNSKDFFAARPELLRWSCRYIASFTDALGFVRSRL